MQLGGVFYNDSADKAARFIMNCNQKNIPLVFLQDVSGFMVGSKSEHAGIIKDGAKMVNAMSNSIVPKFTIIIGNSYGAGNYAMCGKAYDPRLIVAWPTAKMAVMGGEQAGKVILNLEEKYGMIDTLSFVIKPNNGDIFQKDVIQLIHELTEVSWQTPFSSRVSSLTNFQYTTVDGDDINISDFISDTDLMDENNLQELKSLALQERTIVNFILSESARVSFVNISLDVPEDTGLKIR